jgi:hypothetical protein
VLKRALVMKRPTSEAGPILILLWDFLEYLALEIPLRSCRLSMPDPAPFRADKEGLFHERSFLRNGSKGLFPPDVQALHSFPS